ncbi:hypothetical protein ABZY33_30315, partial [Streptomyces sp. NPDC006552]
PPSFFSFFQPTLFPHPPFVLSAGFRGWVGARAATRPTCVYVETETADTVSGPPPAQAWWDVPVAETAERAAAVEAREEYDRNVTTRRHHL